MSKITVKDGRSIYCPKKVIFSVDISSKYFSIFCIYFENHNILTAKYQHKKLRSFPLELCMDGRTDILIFPLSIVA